MTREEENWIIRVVRRFPELSFVVLLKLSLLFLFYYSVCIYISSHIHAHTCFNLNPKFFFPSSCQETSAQALIIVLLAVFDTYSVVWWLDYGFLPEMPWISSSLHFAACSLFLSSKSPQGQLFFTDWVSKYALFFIFLYIWVSIASENTLRTITNDKCLRVMRLVFGFWCASWSSEYGPITYVHRCRTEYVYVG